MTTILTPIPLQHQLYFMVFPCRSFYQCKGQAKNCFVSNYNYSPGDFIDIPKNCSHYKKALIKNNEIQKPNWEVVLWLDTQITEGALKVRIDYEDDEGQVSPKDYDKGYTGG